jgi:hypothetical protein
VIRSQSETEKLITWLYRNDYVYLHQLILINVWVGPKKAYSFCEAFSQLYNLLKNDPNLQLLHFTQNNKCNSGVLSVLSDHYIVSRNIAWTGATLIRVNPLKVGSIT